LGLLVGCCGRLPEGLLGLLLGRGPG